MDGNGSCGHTDEDEQPSLTRKQLENLSQIHKPKGIEEKTNPARCVERLKRWQQEKEEIDHSKKRSAGDTEQSWNARVIRVVSGMHHLCGMQRDVGVIVRKCGGSPENVNDGKDRSDGDPD
jgi:hypothetical protein